MRKVSDSLENPAKKPPRFSKAWKVAAGLVVSGGLLALVLSSLDLSRAWIRVQAAHPSWLLAALGASFSVLLVRGFRFRALTLGAPFADVTASVAVQNFLLRITPLRAGELFLPWALKRRCNEPMARTLVGLVLVRLADLCVVALAALVGGLAWFGAGEGSTLVVLGASVVLLGLLLWRFRPALRLGLRVALACARVVGLDQKPAVQRIAGKIEAALADGEGLSRRRWLVVAGGTGAIAALQFLLFGCLLAAFGSTPDTRQLLVGASLAQITGALPLTTVGSFGTHEAGWIAGFVWVGLPLEDAALTAVASQVITLAFAGLFALPAWLYLGGTPQPVESKGET